MRKTAILILLLLLSSSMVTAGDEKNKIQYEKHRQDPVLKKMKEEREKAQKKEKEKTKKIKEKQKEEKKAKKEKRRDLITDMAGVYPPKSKESFTTFFHFPPVRQYMTGTCWSYSATSFFESEIYRLTRKKIKLSEIWTAYYEFIEKARRFIRERGASHVEQGSEFTSVLEIWKKYGVVPAEAYSGVIIEGEKHDHAMLMKEIKYYLNFVKKNKLWNEEYNLKHVALILDRYLGRPPEEFEYEGKTMTSQEFLAKETGLNLDDYVAVMSTSYFPFFTRQEFRAVDNWWHCKDYINIPLDLWFQIVAQSISSGYTLVLGGDVSEPGKLGMKDIAFIPTFDIPAAYIDQDSREYRIYNKTTADDHAVHLVGHTFVKEKDWFLIKDSGSSSTWGAANGYYFFREDYIRLKMLFFAVHKDMVKDILAKINQTD